ncbi:glutamyl-tRNA reductase [Salsipaludibacter albus]|uniref:glutamyl-tRNA reductase n=1 Tax=Salsipaludibacter albus TaxID=2849650 RepID=UPI001EE4869D|nr:glutamyl-tRNA reductase [Salsipaludibacter albus]MBY5161096.1 glutamyl-tRNA reductase [Salsipaludibacter albus]
MPLLVVGASHRTSDLELLERLAVPSDERRKVLRDLVALEHVLEAVLLSTCNRVEVYVHLSKFHPGLDEVTDFLADRAGDRAEDFLDSHEVHYDHEVADHLFRVSGGVESMVVGERQINLQVRDAMELARHEGTARRMLLRLFRQGVRVGRRLRNETAIGAGGSSMVDIALASLTADGSLAPNASSLVVGAGKVGALAAARLTGHGGLAVWNRSADKADRLARRHDAVVADDLATGVAAADLVVCTTGASAPLLTPELVGDRSARPLVLLDLAMPHNVAAACADLPGVTVVGLADVRRAADATLQDEVLRDALELVDDEVEAFSAWMSAIEVEPTIRALRRRAEQVRRAELQRLDNRLRSLDDSQRQAVDALTEGIVNTFLHQPTIRLKDRADDGTAQVVVDALRDLFDLDDGPK